MPNSVPTLIVQEANNQGVPSSIALGVANQESGFNPNAVGAAGEVGVFQLLPSSFPGQDISDLETNIQLGVSYLASLYQQFGDWDTALAAYNTGPGNVSKGIIPASTQQYVQSVLAYAGQGASPSAATGAGEPGVLATSDDGDVTASIDPSVFVPAALGIAAALMYWAWG